MNKTAAIISSSLVVVLWIPVTTSANAQSRQLPNQIDLKTAYCIAAIQNTITLIETRYPGDNRPLPESTRRSLDKTYRNLHRLRLYLVPRIMQLDPLGLLAAQKAGQEDAVRAVDDMFRCIETCKDAGCATKCTNESEAFARTQTCNDLSFLPF